MFFQDSPSSSETSDDGGSRPNHRGSTAAPGRQPQPHRGIHDSIPEAEQSIRAFAQTLDGENSPGEHRGEAADNSRSRTLRIETTPVDNQSGGRDRITSAGVVAQVRQFNAVSSSSASASSQPPHSLNVRVFRKQDTSSSSDGGSDGESEKAAVKSSSKAALRRLPLASLSSDSESEGATTRRKEMGDATARLPPRDFFPNWDKHVIVNSSEDEDSDTLTLDSARGEDRRARPEPCADSAEKLPSAGPSRSSRDAPPHDASEVSDTPPAARAEGKAIAGDFANTHRQNRDATGKPAREGSEALTSLVSIGDVDTLSSAISDRVQAAIEAQEERAASHPHTPSPGSVLLAANSVSLATDAASAAMAAEATGAHPSSGTEVEQPEVGSDQQPAPPEHSVSVASPAPDAGSLSAALDTRAAPLITGAGAGSDVSSTVATTAVTIERQVTPQTQSRQSPPLPQHARARPANAFGATRLRQDADEDTLTEGSENDAKDSLSTPTSASEVDSRDEQLPDDASDGGGWIQSVEEEEEEGVAAAADVDRSWRARNAQLPPGCPAAEDTADESDSNADGPQDDASPLSSVHDEAQEQAAAPQQVPPLQMRRENPAQAPLESTGAEDEQPLLVASLQLHESQTSDTTSLALRQPLSCSSPREYPGGTRSDAVAAAADEETAATLAQARALFPLQEAGRWTDFLATLPITDATALSAVYHTSEALSNDAEERDETMLKVLSLLCRPPISEGRGRDFLVKAAPEGIGAVLRSRAGEDEGSGSRVDAMALDDAADDVPTPLRDRGAWRSPWRLQERAVLQAATQRLALEMYEMQQRMAEAGLMGRRFTTVEGTRAPTGGHPDDSREGKEEGDASGGAAPVICRGITSLHVDADCRLIAELDIEPCCVCVSDFMAFQAFPLGATEVVAVIKTCTTKLAALHGCGFTHGALHGGNVLLSTDDGHCTLTQPNGVMSAYLLPSDLSALSPARARALLPIVDRIWPRAADQEASGTVGGVSGSRGQRLGQRPTPLDADEKLAWFMVETVANDRPEGPSATQAQQMEGPTPPRYVPTMQDDLFALGNLAVLLLLGVPVFHGARLSEAVRTLAAVFPVTRRAEAVAQRAAICEKYVLSALRSTFAVLRYHQAGYDRAFLREVEMFICDCLISGCVPHNDDDRAAEDEERAAEASSAGATYANAVDLLGHPLLKRLSAGQPGADTTGASAATAAEDEESSINDMMHRLVYPVYTSMESTKASCGTRPYLARLHRNSIFAARADALRSCLLHEWRHRLPHGHRHQERPQHRDHGRTQSADSALTPPSLPAHAAEEMLVVDVVAGLWPFLEGRAKRWTVPFPSVSSCCCCLDAPADGATSGRDAPVEVAEAFFPACSPSLCFRVDEAGQRFMLSRKTPVESAVEENLEDVKGCRILPNVHTLLFQGKEHTALKLSRNDMEPLRGTVDTLVLKDLDHCYVEVTTHMRFVILENVHECEVLLGPCLACYARDVYDCPTVAMAGSHLMLDRVERVGLYYSGPTPPTAFAAADDADVKGSWPGEGLEGSRRRPLSYSGRSFVSDRADDATTTVRDVQMEPYGLAYPGLSEDFATVGLAQEHVATILSSFGDADAVAEAAAGRPTAERAFVLLAVDGTGHEYPYSHALAAYGHRFVHRDDNESDVYFFFNELRGKDVHIVGVHGGPEKPTTSPLSCNGGDDEDGVPSSWMKSPSQPSRSSLYRDMQRRWLRPTNASHDAQAETQEVTHGNQGDAAGNASSTAEAPCYPLIFILDLVEDVVIRDCSECTVFVLGSKNSVVVERCRHMRVFALARESVVEDCVGVDVFAFVTEYMGVVHCQSVTVAPLFLQCPYFDAILGEVLLETMEEKTAIFAAFEERDVAALNIVMQGVTPDDGSVPAGDRMVGLSGCTDTIVKDAQWYDDHAPSRANPEEDVDEPLLIHVNVPLNEPTSSQVGVDRDLSACNFFLECVEADGRDMEEAFQHVAFCDVVYSTEDHDEIMEAGTTTSAATAPVQLQRLHDLINPTLLRMPRSFAIRAATTSANPGSSDYLRQHSSGTNTGDSGSGAVGQTAPDLVLERIAMGGVHLIEAVGNLFIRNCTGPLDIVVCAAQNVVMEGCENVILRTACFTFAAQDCHHCHVALHVNTRPRYLRCSDMLTSTLNITTVEMEALIASVGVQEEVNLFNRPAIVGPTASTAAGRTASATEDNGCSPQGHNGKRAGVTAALAASTGAVFNGVADTSSPHAFCTECVCDAAMVAGGLRASVSLSASASLVALGGPHEKGPLPASPATDEAACASVGSLAQAFARLRTPVTIVAPLPGLVVGITDAPFLGRLESRVGKEEKRAPVEDGLMSALAFLAESDLPALDRSEDVQVRRQALSPDALSLHDDSVRGAQAPRASHPEAVPAFDTAMSADGEMRAALFGSAAVMGGVAAGAASQPHQIFSPHIDSEQLSRLGVADAEDEEGDELELHSKHLRAQQQPLTPPQVKDEVVEDVAEVVVAADNTVSIRESPPKAKPRHVELADTQKGPAHLGSSPSGSASSSSSGEVVRVRRFRGTPPPPPPLKGLLHDDSPDLVVAPRAGEDEAVSPLTPTAERQQREGALRPPTPSPAKTLTEDATAQQDGADEAPAGDATPPQRRRAGGAPPPPPPPPPADDSSPLPEPAEQRSRGGGGSAEASPDSSGDIFIAPKDSDGAKMPIVDRYGDLEDSSDGAGEDEDADEVGGEAAALNSSGRASLPSSDAARAADAAAASDAKQALDDTTRECPGSLPCVLDITSPLPHQWTHGLRESQAMEGERGDNPPTAKTNRNASAQTPRRPQTASPDAHVDPTATTAAALLRHPESDLPAGSTPPQQQHASPPHEEAAPTGTPADAVAAAAVSITSPFSPDLHVARARDPEGVSDTELRRARPAEAAPQDQSSSAAGVSEPTSVPAATAGTDVTRMLGAPRQHALVPGAPTAARAAEGPLSGPARRRALAEARAQHAAAAARLSEADLANRVALALAKVAKMGEP